MASPRSPVRRTAASGRYGSEFDSDGKASVEADARDSGLRGCLRPADKIPATVASAAWYSRRSDIRQSLHPIGGFMRCRALALVSLLSCTVFAQARSPLDLANASVPSNGRRISYGADPLQYGELRMPTSKGPHPVAIIVHGGCWLAKLGNMDERAISMEMIRPVAAALTDAGIATWNVEYRRLGHAGGGWPGTFQDVAHAADF